MKLIRVTQILSSVMATVLAVTVFFDWMTIHLLLAITLVAGLVSSFAVPARMTLSPSLVPKEDITAAIAVGSALFNSSTVIGPALAGLLIVKWGFGFAFAFNAISFVAQYVTLRMITLLRQEHQAGKGQSVFTDIVEGVRYIGEHAGILPVLLLALVAAILTRPLTDLLAGLAEVGFGGGKLEVSWLFSAMGVGGIVGSLWMANRNRLQGTTAIFLGGMALVTVLTVVFATANSFVLAAIYMSFLGLVTTVTMNGAQILIQSSVDGAMRARVMSLYSLNFRAGPSIGAMLIGGLSSFFGLQITGAGSAILCESDPISLNTELA